MTALLVAQLAAHLAGCVDDAAPPPLPACVDLGCAFALCSAHNGPCYCNGEVCTFAHADIHDAGVDATNFSPELGGQAQGCVSAPE